MLKIWTILFSAAAFHLVTFINAAPNRIERSKEFLVSSEPDDAFEQSLSSAWPLDSSSPTPSSLLLQNINDSASAISVCDPSSRRCREGIWFIAKELVNMERLDLLEESVIVKSAKECAEKCFEGCCQTAVYSNVEKKCHFIKESTVGKNDDNCEVEPLTSYVDNYNGSDVVEITCLSCGSASKIGTSGSTQPPGGPSSAAEQLVHDESEETEVERPSEAVEILQSKTTQQPIIASVIDTSISSQDKETQPSISRNDPKLMERACIIVFEVDPNADLAYFRGEDHLEASGADHCAYLCYRDACSAAVFTPPASPDKKGVCERRFDETEKCNATLRRDYYYKTSKPVYLQCFRCLPKKPQTKLPLEATTLQPASQPVAAKQEAGSEAPPKTEVTAVTSGEATAAPETTNTLELSKTELKEVEKGVPGTNAPDLVSGSMETSGGEEESKEEATRAEGTISAETSKSLENEAKSGEQTASSVENVEASKGKMNESIPTPTSKEAHKEEVVTEATSGYESVGVTVQPPGTVPPSGETLEKNVTLASAEMKTSAPEMKAGTEYGSAFEKSPAETVIPSVEAKESNAFISDTSVKTELAQKNESVPAAKSEKEEPEAQPTPKAESEVGTHGSVPPAIAKESQKSTLPTSGAETKPTESSESTPANETEAKSPASALPAPSMVVEGKKSTTSVNGEGEYGSSTVLTPSSTSHTTHAVPETEYSLSTAEITESKETLKESSGKEDSTEAKSKEEIGVSKEASESPTKTAHSTGETTKSTSPQVEGQTTTSLTTSQAVTAVPPAITKKSESDLTGESQDEAGLAPPKKVDEAPHEYLQGCIVTFQADPYSEHPAESSAGFQASTIARTPEVCAGRCYQDGCTGAKYDPATNECVLGYGGKQVCNRGPEHFFYEANETVWIHCTGCRLHKPGDEGVNILIHPYKAKGTAKTSTATIAPETKALKVEPEKSRETQRTTISVASEASESKSLEVTAEEREGASSAASEEQGESTEETTAKATSSVSNVSEADGKAEHTTEASVTTVAAEISATKGESSSAPVASSVEKKKEIPNEELNIDVVPTAVDSEKTVVPLSKPVTTTPFGTTIPGHGCVVSFQAGPIATRPTEFTSEFVPKGTTPTAEECAKLCYMEGCTGAKFDPGNRECSLTFGDHQQCDENEEEHHSVEATEVLWIHCIGCKPEFTESTLGLLAEDTAVSTAITESSSDEESSTASGEGSSVPASEELDEKSLSTVDQDVRAEKDANSKIKTQTDHEMVDRLPEASEEENEETLSEKSTPFGAATRSQAEISSVEAKPGSGALGSSSFASTSTIHPDQLPLSVSEIKSEESTAGGEVRLENNPAVVVLEGHDITKTPLTSSSVESKETSISAEHSESVETSTKGSHDKEMSTINRLVEGNKAVADVSMVTETVSTAAVVEEVAKTINDDELETTIKPELLLALTAQTPLRIPLDITTEIAEGSTISTIVEESESITEPTKKKTEIKERKEGEEGNIEFQHEAEQTPILAEITAEAQEEVTKHPETTTFDAERHGEVTNDTVAAITNVIVNVASSVPESRTEASRTEATASAMIEGSTTEPSVSKIDHSEQEKEKESNIGFQAESTPSSGEITDKSITQEKVTIRETATTPEIERHGEVTSDIHKANVANVASSTSETPTSESIISAMIEGSTTEPSTKKIDDEQKEEKKENIEFQQEAEPTPIPAEITPRSIVPGETTQSESAERNGEVTSDILAVVTNVVTNAVDNEAGIQTKAPHPAATTGISGETTGEHHNTVTPGIATMDLHFEVTSLNAVTSEIESHTEVTSSVIAGNASTPEPFIEEGHNEVTSSNFPNTATIESVGEVKSNGEVTDALMGGQQHFEVTAGVPEKKSEGEDNIAVTEQTAVQGNIDANIQKVIQAASERVTDATSTETEAKVGKKELLSSAEGAATDSTKVGVSDKEGESKEAADAGDVASTLSSLENTKSGVPATESGAFGNSNLHATDVTDTSAKSEIVGFHASSEHMTSEPPVEAVSDLVDVLSQNSKIEDVIGRTLSPSDHVVKRKEKESFVIDDTSVMTEKDEERLPHVAINQFQEISAEKFLRNGTKMNPFHETTSSCPGRIEFEISSIGELPQLNVTSEVAVESPADCARRCYETADCLLAGFVPKPSGESTSAVCLLTTDVGACSLEEKSIPQHISDSSFIISCLKCSKCNYTISAITELTRITQADTVEPVLSIGQCAEICWKQKCAAAQYNHKSNFCSLTSVKRRDECSQEMPVAVNGNEPVLLECVQCFA